MKGLVSLTYKLGRIAAIPYCNHSCLHCVFLVSRHTNQALRCTPCLGFLRSIRIRFLSYLNSLLVVAIAFAKAIYPVLN